MTHTDYFDCSFCGGTVEYTHDYRGEIIRLKADCREACENNPAFNPSALFDVAEAEIERAGEAAFERRMADYYGGSGPVTMQEQLEAARKLKREMDGR